MTQQVSVKLQKSSDDYPKKMLVQEERKKDCDSARNFADTKSH